MRMSVWVKKYLPSVLKDVHGHDEALKKLQNLVENYKKGKKGIFLYGGTGNGKTSAVYALAADLNLELIEINASDTRNAESINSLLGAAVNQMSFFHKGKIILVDEIEGVTGTKDRGGIQAVLKIMPTSSFPIIIVGVDAYDDKVKSLRKECDLVEFKPLEYEAIHGILRNICSKEKLSADEDALKHLARISSGDARAAINDLQTIASAAKKITMDDVKDLGVRDSTKTMQFALTKIFKATTPEIALRAFDDVSEDLDKIFLWVEENIPHEYLKPEHLQKAFNNLSLADVFFGRIRRWQYYRFYVYCYNLLSAGIAMSKDQKYPVVKEYKQTSRLLSIWIYNNANAKRKSIAEKVASKTHVSNKVAFRKYVPYLQIIFKKNKEEANNISHYLDLDSEEVMWLKTK